MPDPEEMHPAELRALRGLIGRRLDYPGPMPQGKLARLVHISPRAMWNYEHGERPIPLLIARAVRQLAHDPGLSWERLPKRWKAQLDRQKWRRRRARRRRERQEPRREPEGPEPPF